MNLNRPFQVVTPTLDGDVLAVLARAGAVRFTPGQVHRILGRNSEEGVRKALRRLAGQGIVRFERVGNAYAYELDHEHIAYHHVVGLARLFNELLQRISTEIESWPSQPVYAAIFGSAARGTMTASSDIDLFLLRPDDAPEQEWQSQVSELLLRVTEWTGNDARDLQFTVGEIAEHGSAEPVIRDVLKDGLVVAGSRSDFARLVRGGRS